VSRCFPEVVRREAFSMEIFVQKPFSDLDLPITDAVLRAVAS
jgi:hypothetical protein